MYLMKQKKSMIASLQMARGYPPNELPGSFVGLLMHWCNNLVVVHLWKEDHLLWCIPNTHSLTHSILSLSHTHSLSSTHRRTLSQHPMGISRMHLRSTGIGLANNGIQRVWIPIEGTRWIWQGFWLGAVGCYWGVWQAVGFWLDSWRKGKICRSKRKEVVE